MENESNVIYEARLEDIVKDTKLEKVYVPDGWEDIKVICADISRPGLFRLL